MTRYLRAKRLVAQGAGEGLRAEKDRKQFENVKQVKKKKKNAESSFSTSVKGFTHGGLNLKSVFL